MAGPVSPYPCSGNPESASTLNYFAGQFVPNGGLVQLSPTGALCVYTSATSDLLLDVAGYLPAGATTLTTLVPARLYDSRPDHRLPASGSVEVQVRGVGGVPADATAALLNVATVLPDALGFVSVVPGPCAGTPSTSKLNDTSGGVVRANNAMTKFGPDGTVCVFTLGSGDLIVDITGYLG